MNPSTPPDPAPTRRLLLLVSATSYRTQAFDSVARALGVEVMHGIHMPLELAELYHVPLALNFADLEGSTARIVAQAQQSPFDAILAVDDTGTLLAAHASAALGLPHNDPASAEAARNKAVMRQMLHGGGLAPTVVSPRGGGGAPGPRGGAASLPRGRQAPAPVGQPRGDSRR